MKRQIIKKWIQKSKFQPLIKNEKGYSTVFLCLIFITLVGVFFMCYTAIVNAITINEQMRQSKIASEMILSYYNDSLEMDYGLLAYDSKKVDMKKILDPYFKGKWQVTPKSTLADLSVFQKQAIEMGKIDLVQDGLDKVTGIGTEGSPNNSNSENLKNLKTQIKDEDVQYDKSDVDQTQRETAKRLLRKIRTTGSPTWTIKDPGEIDSKIFSQVLSFEKGSAKPLNLVEKGIVSSYIFEHFNDYAQWQNRPNTRNRTANLCFEGGEIEYILCGHREGMANQLQICGQIFVMREVINGVFLMVNPEKSKMITEVSVLISCVFPIAEPLIQSGIIILWSCMESVYEVNLLLSDHKIPIAKNSGADWYTDLDPQLTKGTGNNVPSKDKEKGLDYRNFLLIFMMAQSDEKTAQRTMSLIDFNLKKANQGIANWSSMVTAHEIRVTGHSGKETIFEDGYILQKK